MHRILWVHQVFIAIVPINHEARIEICSLYCFCKCVLKVNFILFINVGTSEQNNYKLCSFFLSNREWFWYNFRLLHVNVRKCRNTHVQDNSITIEALCKTLSFWYYISSSIFINVMLVFSLINYNILHINANDTIRIDNKIRRSRGRYHQTRFGSHKTNNYTYAKSICKLK